MKSTKKCTKCSIEKDPVCFPVDNRRENGRRSQCKDCCDRRSMKWLGDRDGTCYVSWASMKARCTNPNHKYYDLYKDRWYCPWADFKVFEEWALSSGYKKGLTIDRIDATLGYGPGNCQWLTRSENTAKGNRERKRTQVEYEGEYYTKKELSVKLGVSRDVLARILRTQGLELGGKLGSTR